MKLQLVRNATLRLRYAGHLILIDPFLAPKHSMDSFAGKSRNPTSDLPMSPDEVLQGAELVIVSHLHPDHFDPLAQQKLPKDLKLICQPSDADTLTAGGFADVVPLADSVTWNGITVTRTKGEHGSGAWLARMGSVMGFVLQADGEPTVYWAGDTIWIDAVESTIHDYQPEVIVTHSAGAIFEPNAPIIMDAAQTIRVCEAAPDATVIATHMESVDHSTVTRADLRAAADAADIDNKRLLIPADGERVTLEQAQKA